jgi:dienelactone hydrolase
VELTAGDTLPIDILRPLAPTTTQMEGKTEQELGQDKYKAYETLGPWIGKHHPKIEYPKIQAIVNHLRADKSHKFVGVVGVCWGGGPAVYLCQEGADPSVDVGVALHPGFAEVPADYEKIAKPFSVQIGELDDVLPPPDQQKVAEIFKNKKDCEIVIHKDQVHGFGSRGDFSVEKDKKAKELCAENVLSPPFTYLMF